MAVGGESSEELREQRADVPYMAHVTDEAEYLRAFADKGGDFENIDFDDPALQAKLDQQLGAVFQNEDGGFDDNDAWRIYASTLGIDLTVRDTLMLGLGHMRDLRGVGAKRRERIRTELERYIPEFPVMEEYAPPLVAGRLYRDPLAVPIEMSDEAGRHTVADAIRLSTGHDDYYANRVRSIIDACEARDRHVQSGANPAIDPTLTAIAAVALTLEQE